MNDFRSVVLATLAYYDALQLPLTAIEVFERLHAPERLGVSARPATLADVTATLAALVALKQVWEGNGYYFLYPDWEPRFARRIEREKIAAQKHRKLARLVRVLAWVPYVRAVFASGSLALESADPKSDLDVLIVTRRGRIFLARTLVSLVASLLGARRTRMDRIAPDKLCMNHWVSDGHLALHHRSIYTAHTYANLVPLISRGGCAERFASANQWVRTWRARGIDIRPQARRTIRFSAAGEAFVRGAERMLDVCGAAVAENLLRRLQIRRIRANPLTREHGGRVLASDAALEFHPRSQEPRTLARYAQALARLGVRSPQEHDSGLAA